MKKFFDILNKEWRKFSEWVELKGYIDAWKHDREIREPFSKMFFGYDTENDEERRQRGS